MCCVQFAIIFCDIHDPHSGKYDIIGLLVLLIFLPQNVVIDVKLQRVFSHDAEFVTRPNAGTSNAVVRVESECLMANFSVEYNVLFVLIVIWNKSL